MSSRDSYQRGVEFLSRATHLMIDLIPRTRASGGSSVLNIRNDVIHSPLKLLTILQAVAAKITLSFVFTVTVFSICSSYPVH